MANINSLSNSVFVLVTVLPNQPNENHKNDKLLGSQVCINVDDIKKIFRWIQSITLSSIYSYSYSTTRVGVGTRVVLE